MAKVTKTFNLEAELYEKLKVLKEEKSFSTISATLQYCIIEAYEQQLRNERRVKKNVGGEEKLDIDERRQKREEDKCRAIAKELGGRLIPSGDGFTCEYYTYNRSTRYKQQVPLLSLTRELLNSQYFPSREACEQAIVKEGKVEDFKPGEQS